MALIRPFLALFLALTLAVTSLGFAVARGHAPAANAMEICTGFSMVTIWVDENGDPVEERHICPDAVSFLAEAGAVPGLPVFDPQLIAALTPVPLSGGDTGEELSPSARGPPSSA